MKVEICEHEFNEIVYVLAKKYFNRYSRRGTYNDYKEIVAFFKDALTKSELNKSKSKRFIYTYPKLAGHLEKERILFEEKVRKEKERQRKLEIARYKKERENMEKESNNAYNEGEEDGEQEEEEECDEEEEY